MKHEQYKKLFFNLGADIKNDITSMLINKQASDIEFNTGIIFNFIDDQMNEVIKRIDVVLGQVQIYSGRDAYWLPVDSLTTDQLIAILEIVETGDYEVWAEFSSD